MFLLKSPELTWKYSSSLDPSTVAILMALSIIDMVAGKGLAYRGYIDSTSGKSFSGANKPLHR